MHSVPRKLTLGLILALGAAACGDDVTVSEQPAPTPVVRSVVVSPSSATILANGSFTFGSAVDADAGLAATVTWTSSNTAVATVNNTGTASGVAAGTTSICATSTADANKSSCAQLTVVSPPVVPAASVQIDAITIGCDAIALSLAPTTACNLNSPVATNNVFGEFQVQTNVNRPVGSTVTGIKLEVLSATNTVEWTTTQTLTSDAMTPVEGLSGQASTSNRVTFTVQSAAYTVSGGTTATPRHLNGQKKIKVSLVGGTGTATSADRDLTFRNANGFHITQTVVLTGNNANGVPARLLDANGRQWTGGTNLTFRSLPVAYTGSINAATHFVSFGGACGNTIRTKVVTGTDAAFAYTSGAVAATADVNSYGITTACGAAYTFGETPSANGLQAGSGDPFINIALGGNFGATNTLNNALSPVEPTLELAPAIRLDNLGPTTPAVNTTPNGRTLGWMNADVALNTVNSGATSNGAVAAAVTDAGYNAASVPATGAPAITYTAYVCSSGTATAATCAGSIPGNLTATGTAVPANGVPQTTLAGFPETLTPTTDGLVIQAIDAFRNRSISATAAIGVDLTQPVMQNNGSSTNLSNVNTGTLSLNVSVYDALSGFNTTGDLTVSGVRVTAGAGTQTRALMTGFGTSTINSTPFATAALTGATSAHLVATPATPAYNQTPTTITMTGNLDVTASVPGYFVIKAQGKDRAGNRSDFFTRVFYRNQNVVPLVTGLNSTASYTGGAAASFPAAAEDSTEIIDGELRFIYPNAGRIIYNRATPAVSPLWDDAGIGNPVAVPFSVPFFLRSVRVADGAGVPQADDATQRPTTVLGRVHNPFGTTEDPQGVAVAPISGVGANGRSADYSAPILTTQVTAAASTIWTPGSGQSIANFTLSLSSCATASSVTTCTWIAEVSGPTGTFANPFTHGIAIVESRNAQNDWRLVNASAAMGQVSITGLTTTITPLFTAPFPTLDNGAATNGRVYQWRITTARAVGYGSMDYRIAGVKTTGEALLSSPVTRVY